MSVGYFLTPRRLGSAKDSRFASSNTTRKNHSSLTTLTIRMIVEHILNMDTRVSKCWKKYSIITFPIMLFITCLRAHSTADNICYRIQVMYRGKMIDSIRYIFLYFCKKVTKKRKKLCTLTVPLTAEKIKFEPCPSIALSNVSISVCLGCCGKFLFSIHI